MVTRLSWWSFNSASRILGFVLVLLGIVFVLSRIQGGRFLRPVITLLSKVPVLRRMMERATKAAIERQNPDLASRSASSSVPGRTGTRAGPRRP